MAEPPAPEVRVSQHRFEAALGLASAWGLLLVGAAVVIVVTVAVGRRVLAERSPFDVDEAEHANAAVELTSALRSGEPEGIVKAVTRQSYYPPVHSFLVTTCYLLRGEELASSRLPSLAMYVLAVLLLGALTYRALRRLQPEAAQSDQKLQAHPVRSCEELVAGQEQQDGGDDARVLNHAQRAVPD